MGEYADYAVEQMSNPFTLRRGPEGITKWDYEEPTQCTWTTLASEVLKLGEMSEQHRGNCVRLLVRRHGDWDFPIGRALINVGISASIKESLGIPTPLPQYPKLKRTN
jgi:hypothetical protein